MSSGFDDYARMKLTPIYRGSKDSNVTSKKKREKQEEPEEQKEFEEPTDHRLKELEEVKDIDSYINRGLWEKDLRGHYDY